MSNEIIDNATIRNILSRQSIREYKDKMLSTNQIETLMACALMAPSAKNEQPCHVRFITNTPMLEQMQKDFRNIIGWGTPAYTKSDVNPFYHNAPVFAAIFSEDDKSVDGGIMVENICIGAKSLGLGTCVIGCIHTMFDDEEVGPRWKKLLDIPEDYKFLIGVAIGYPDETPPVKERDSSKIKVIR